MWRSLMVVMLSLTAGEVLAQETSFLLINATGLPIGGLAVSPTDLNMWTPEFSAAAADRRGRAPSSHVQCAHVLLSGRLAGQLRRRVPRLQSGRISISAR